MCQMGLVSVNYRYRYKIIHILWNVKYYFLQTDLVSPVLYSTHGGKTKVRFSAFANPKAPKKWSAWFPNRPTNYN